MTAISNPHVVTDLFNAFAEAQKAMTELPLVRAEHSALVERYEGLEHLHYATTENLVQCEAEIERLKSELAAREAALSAATFRESELRSKHSALRSLLADGLDSTKSELAGGQSVADPTSKDGLTGIKSIEDTSKTGGTSRADLGQSDTGPTTPQDNASTSTGQSLNATESSVTSTENANTEGQSEADPTVNSQITQPENASPPRVDDSTYASPTDDKSYTSKPASMFWGEWLSLGGSPPPWMSDDAAKAHLDAHNNPYTSAAE